MVGVMTQNSKIFDHWACKCNKNFNFLNFYYLQGETNSRLQAIWIHYLNPKAIELYLKIDHAMKG